METFDEKTPLNDRHTIIHGNLMEELFFFIYDHKQEELFVEPNGLILHYAYTRDLLQTIPELKSIVTTSETFKASIISTVPDDVVAEASEVLDDWFEEMIQQARDKRSSITN